MEIFRGQLDEISRPASSELTGSRVSSVSLPHSGRISSPGPLSLVVLTHDVQSDVAAVSSGGADVYATNKYEDEEEGLKLQKAIEEMRRLDEILSLKTVQGQEARRQRREIRDKLWQELLQNTPKGRSECAHEASNTRSFLALNDPTPKVHKEDLNFEPVFDTEAPDCDDDRSCANSRSNRSGENVELSAETDFVEIEQELSQGSHCEASKIKKKHKNFVKRNIELISGEGGQEVLTQPEKDRLDELLREIDQEEEDCARGADAEDDLWAVSVSTGQGYTPEPPDLKQLHDIDSRIRLLLPLEEFASLQTSYSNLSEFQALAGSLGPRGTELLLHFDTHWGDGEREGEGGEERGRTHVFLTTAAIRGSGAGGRTEGEPLPGEKALKDEKERRGQERRLQEIQQQLHSLRHSQDDKSPDLTEEQLQSLLEDCELAETWTRDIDVNDFTPR